MGAVNITSQNTKLKAISRTLPFTSNTATYELMTLTPIKTVLKEVYDVDDTAYAAILADGGFYGLEIHVELSSADRTATMSVNSLSATYFKAGLTYDSSEKLRQIGVTSIKILTDATTGSITFTFYK